MLCVGMAVVASAEGAESSASSQFALVGGNTLLESAGPGVWVGTPVPTDCSTSLDRPSAVRPNVSPPRGLLAWPRAWKNARLFTYTLLEKSKSKC